MSSRFKAVTLVELLIAVLIVGAMAFVVVPRMGLTASNIGKVETTAKKLAAAIRYARSLAISNAATNTAGYSLEMTGPAKGYSGYRIVNLSNNKVLRSENIDNAVSCTGANDFDFGTLGNRNNDNDALVVSGAGKTINITVISATGMVKCQKQ